METPRLILREFDVSDADKMYLLNLDPEVIRFTGDKPFASVKSARDFLAGYQDYRKNGFGRWAVILKKGNGFIGWCGLKRNEEGFVDLGFRFFKSVWNRGFATESAEACIEYGFSRLSLSEIIGRVARDNRASVRVLEKLNMTFWKTGACEGIPDALYYRITRMAFLNFSG